MFTGIIEEIGKVIYISKGIKSATFTFGAEKILHDVKTGDSINTNGACLTVAELTKKSFTSDIMVETMNKSNLHLLKPGSMVNLERAMKADGRFGGHMVSGHIDGTGMIAELKQDENAVWITINADESLMKYIVYKGSVALDGISLTIARVDKTTFKVSVIPHTSKQTTLLLKKVGDLVNIECDMIAKYIEKFTANRKMEDKITGIDMNFLKESGYID